MPGDWEDPDPWDAWRGDQHLVDWPEELAGPEYWLNLREMEEGEE